MKKIFHTLFITALIVSTTSINSMKRLTPDTDIATIQQPLWLADEVVVPIAAYSEPKEKNVLMQLCKQLQQCLKNGKDQIITANPLTVHWRDRERALWNAVRVYSAYPGGAREDKYYLVQKLLDTESVTLYWMENVLGKTPLHYAIENDNNQMRELLVAYNADDMPHPLLDPLPEAIYQGNATDVKILLTLEETDPNLALANGNTPLHIAAHEGHIAIVKLLIKNKADINQKNKNGHTPLYTASEKGHVKVVNLLIRKDADVDQADDSGRTPLYRASENGHIEVVLSLLTAEAKVNKANSYGRTPLSVASKAGHTEIVNLLTESGANEQFSQEEETSLDSEDFYG